MTSLVLQDLLKRLKQIQVECGVSNTKSSNNPDKPQSNFRQLRRQMADDMKSIKILISDRDELAAKDPNDVKLPQLSAHIRKDIDAVDKKLEQLISLKNAKVKSTVQDDDMETKENVISIMQDLLVETRNMEAQRVVARGMSTLTPGRPRSKSKSKPTNKVSLFRDNLLGTTTTPSEPKQQEMTTLSSALEDIDFESGLQRLDQIEREQDLQLEEMAKDARRIKEIVIGIGAELDVQGQMITQIEDDLVQNQQHLERVQTKLKKSIVAARGGSKFTIDIILLLIVLAILTYIYRLVKS
ncbi:hypothetical protein RCL1_007762 [Eukaryota sp. TZLM3-RCL]